MKYIMEPGDTASNDVKSSEAEVKGYDAGGEYSPSPNHSLW